MKKNVLLCYELVPEETLIVLLENVSEKTFAELCSVSGLLVNSDDLTDDQHRITDVIGKNLAEAGQWHKFIRHDPFEIPPNTQKGVFTTVEGLMDRDAYESFLETLS